jgi:hypothetical protein
MIYVSTFSTLIRSSSLLCILGLAMGSFLLREQKKLVGTTPSASADGRGAKYGVQSTAIAHCLPQALFAWALLLLAIQGIWITFADLPLPLSFATFLPVAAMLVTASVGIRKAVYPQQEVSRIQPYRHQFPFDFSPERTPHNSGYSRPLTQQHKESHVV